MQEHFTQFLMKDHTHFREMQNNCFREKLNPLDA